jgi:hypothetical protein
MTKSEMTASIVHPYLTSIDKVTKKQDQNEYVGVLVDQEQKDIKEVLIEFLFVPLQKQILLNKIITTNDVKFQTDLIASNDFYDLTSKNDLYLIPARQKNRVFTVGSKVPITAGGKITTGILKTAKGYLYVVSDATKNYVISEKSKRGAKEFSYKFSQANEYTVELFFIQVL